MRKHLEAKLNRQSHMHREYVAGLVAGYEARLQEQAAHYEARLQGQAAHYEVRLKEQAAHYEARLQEQAARLGAEIHELNTRTEAILSSTSWRVTRPMRVLMRLAKNDPSVREALWRRIRGAQEGDMPLVSPAEPQEGHIEPQETHIAPAEPASPPEAIAGHIEAPIPPPVPLEVAIRVVYLSEGPATNVGYDYRCRYYAEAMRAFGADVCILTVQDVIGRQDIFMQADVLIIWRAAFHEATALAVQRARENGAVVIFDVDDLIFKPELATVEYLDGMRFHDLNGEYFRMVRETAMASDMYIAPTDALAIHLRAFGRPTFRLPNGYDDDFFLAARLAVRRRRLEPGDGLFRIGYAGGTKTHQKDFSFAAGAVARILREFPQARLVLFKREGEELLELSEFPFLPPAQVEWREFVPHSELPSELARFDISLAPLETGNPFCEAKSELKYFESALAGSCVIASPTEPFAAAIRHGETGFLARDEDEWYDAMHLLIANASLREEMSAVALRSVLWPYGYQRRAVAISNMMHRIFDGRQNEATVFTHDIKAEAHVSRPAIGAYDVLYSHDSLALSYVTVVVPLYNYKHFLCEALDSVKAQGRVDLVVVDDCSADGSAAAAVEWARENAHALGRVVVAAHRENSKLDVTRNTGIELSETPYVFLLDPDNRLLPGCLEKCLNAITESGAAFAYPMIRLFGDDEGTIGGIDYTPAILTGANYIDAMAMVSKAAWARAGGYKNFSVSGWEDYSLWCAFAELGLRGVRAGDEVLAEYRVHGGSMLRTTTDVAEKKKIIVAEMEARHPWLTLVEKVI